MTDAADARYEFSIGGALHQKKEKEKEEKQKKKAGSSSVYYAAEEFAWELGMTD